MLQPNKSDVFFFSGWLEFINTAFFPDEVTVPCNSAETRFHTLTRQPSLPTVKYVKAPGKAHHVDLRVTSLTAFSYPFSTSAADLSFTWTMRATTRTTLTGTVGKLHAWWLTRLVCLSALCVTGGYGGFFILVILGSLYSLLLSATELSVILFFTSFLSITTQQLGAYTQTHKNMSFLLVDIMLCRHSDYRFV